MPNEFDYSHDQVQIPEVAAGLVSPRTSISSLSTISESEENIKTPAGIYRFRHLMEKTEEKPEISTTVLTSDMAHLELIKLRKEKMQTKKSKK